MADDAQTWEPVLLPDDLVLLILSKLPLKSLKRFACVCKLWALLLQNPHFVSNWSLSHYNHDTSLLVSHIARDSNIKGGIRSSLFSLSKESIHDMVKLEWPNPLQEDDPNFYVMGSTSINGILCLYQRGCGPHGPKAIVLWNPTTQESKVVPPSPVDSVPPNQDGDFTLVGFGYDRVRDDYKVIRHACFYHRLADLYDIPGPSMWEIYSLRSNSWRTLGWDDSVFPACFGYDNRLYLDGMCHWTGDKGNFDDYLVSFDLSNEVFYTTRMDMSPIQDPLRNLLLLNESVAVITNPRDTTYIYISILGQVGVKESWTRLFVIESLPLPCIIRPLGIGKKGNILFVKGSRYLHDSELIQFNLCTYMIEDLGVKGAKDWSQIVLYKESFLPIGGINN